MMPYMNYEPKTIEEIVMGSGDKSELHVSEKEGK